MNNKYDLICILIGIYIHYSVQVYYIVLYEFKFTQVYSFLYFANNIIILNSTYFKKEKRK
jgi:hypothetical protein